MSFSPFPQNEAKDRSMESAVPPKLSADLNSVLKSNFMAVSHIMVVRCTSKFVLKCTPTKAKQECNKMMFAKVWSTQVQSSGNWLGFVIFPYPNFSPENLHFLMKWNGCISNPNCSIFNFQMWCRLLCRHQFCTVLYWWREVLVYIRHQGRHLDGKSSFANNQLPRKVVVTPSLEIFKQKAQ